MADVTVAVNGYEYSEEEFRKDLTRMFDTYRDKDDSDMGNMNCNGVCCDDCPLYKVSCNMKTTNSFKTIGIVYEWAIDHPAIRNREMLIKTFGDEVLSYIEAEAYEDGWMSKEYKEPSKEPRKEEND